MFEKTPRARIFALVSFAISALAGPGIGSASVTPDTAAYARVLKHFVTDNARVHYSSLKADPTDLNDYLKSLASIDASELKAQPDADQIAFWINAYNAITLKTIIDHYPIRAHGLAALRYPSSSIRQISGAWKDRSWVVTGSKMSLDDIENEMLRNGFGEPRIHMALVCAAKGCPPLRDEPYNGANLEKQLNDQTQRYLASRYGMRLEAKHHRMAVSSIFKWFAKDFGKEDGVRGFLISHAPTAATRAAMEDPKIRIVFIDYDWRLNEAPGRLK